MNKEENDYFEKYLTIRRKHTNLLKKQNVTILKYKKEIERLKYLLTKPIRIENTNLELTNILKAVCSATGIIPHDILSQNRQRSISTARHLFCYISYKHFGYCLTEIGRYLIRDHSTVINSVNKFQGFLDFKYKEEVKYYAQCKNILSISS